MKQLILGLGAVIVVAIIALAAYVLRPSEQASAPIQATPVATLAPTVTPTSAPAQASEAPTEAAPQPTLAQAASAANDSGLTGSVVYQIVQAESQASFAIFEELRGSPFTAVGMTDQVAGEILIDFDNAAAQLGVIQVNARTLKTDSSLRDRAISNQILNTSRYEFITFEPTAISGLPSSISPGETITFQITGNLTIREITKEATFEMQVTLVDRNRLEGQGQATVLRSDYNLIIPSVPSVANVADNVLLEIKFTATAAP